MRKKCTSAAALSNNYSTRMSCARSASPGVTAALSSSARSLQAHTHSLLQIIIHKFIIHVIMKTSEMQIRCKTLQHTLTPPESHNRPKHKASVYGKTLMSVPLVSWPHDDLRPLESGVGRRDGPWRFRLNIFLGVLRGSSERIWLLTENRVKASLSPHWGGVRRRKTGTKVSESFCLTDTALISSQRRRWFTSQEEITDQYR